jgi:hypothetical protein
MSELEVGRWKIALTSAGILLGAIVVTVLLGDHLPEWSPIAVFLGGGVSMQIRRKIADRALKARLAREREARRRGVQGPGT